MKKIPLAILVLFIFIDCSAQFNYSHTDGTIPVTGGQYGVIHGRHSTMLMNRDDLNSKLITPAIFNMTYHMGVERIQWHTPHFGFGQQLLVWCSGGAYAGNIDAGGAELSALTELVYIKLPALFWWKSYSRWHPDRRVRVNAYFGPYAALLADGNEKWSTIGGGTESFHNLGVGNYTIDDAEGKELFDGDADDSNPFKSFDYGFVMGGGLEVRLWRRTVIGLTLRADLGQADVENKDFSVVNPSTGERYKFYKDITNKFSAPTIVGGQVVNYNRPETLNFSYGLQLSVRKYLVLNSFSGSALFKIQYSRTKLSWQLSC